MQSKHWNIANKQCNIDLNVAYCVYLENSKHAKTQYLIYNSIDDSAYYMYMCYK